MLASLLSSLKEPAAVGLPTQALEEKELRRWVIPPGTKPWKLPTANPSRADIVGYVPSAAEQAWMTGAATGRICSISKQPLVKAAADAWIAYSASPRVWAPGGKPEPKPSPEQLAALSYFELNVSHSTTRASTQGAPSEHLTRRRRVIEPLHGIARPAPRL
eukprot:scaffold19501_cov59-Phaeocystis_antarctica.AAC.2